MAKITKAEMPALAEQIVKCLGDKENVARINHCATRLRVNPVDNPLQLEQQTLPYTGRYEIRVLQTRNGARRGGTRPYTLNISIVDPGASSAAAPNVVEPTP